ncbi:MAG: S26 family signal peptidase [Synergistaceae bacterium]|nr:S26 family signal peptidase [Synergistaceae bacterium]
MKKKFIALLALLLFLCVTASALFLFHHAGFRVNRSASLPGILYAVSPLGENERIYRGDIVLIDLSKISNPVISRGVERGYVNMREPMLKRIGAAPGDSVTLENDLLRVNGVVSRAVTAPFDSRGGPLAPWPTPLILRPGQYWLVSDPERGFDSRYFGPVGREAFTHRAKPLF